jgi:hypothetical protein
MRKFIISALATAVLVTVVSDANAGGLFGKGGLIRGSVGQIMAPVQHAVTPVLQGAVVTATTTVGTVYGGAAGGVAGSVAGQVINNCAAGHC